MGMKDLYDSKISKVVLSNRLEETPMVIVTTKYGQSANMGRITRGQAFGNAKPSKSTKILEINFRHPLMISLKDTIADNADSENAKDLARLMYDSALMQSGFIIEADEITDFAKRVDRIVRERLGVESDAEVEAMPEFAEDEDDDEEDEDDDEDDEDLDADNDKTEL